ncbi:MAG: PilN domain-containing protein [Phycisphaerales bacterium]|nr:PilN domain-containing protein [Phycisphaerales bacterium]
MSHPKENPNQGASFLPAEYVKGKGQLRANVMALFLFTLVIVGVVGAFVVNHQRWRRVHTEQKIVAAAFEEEASKITQLEALEKQRIDLIERAEVVTALKDRVPRSVLLGEVVRSIPDGLTLTMVNLEGERVKVKVPKLSPKELAAQTRTLKGKTVGKGKDGESAAKPPKVLPPRFKFSLAVEGLAQENDQVADFLAAIKSSPLFGDVELQYINETTIDKQRYRKFKVTMNLVENADARLVDGTQEVEIGRVDFGIAGAKTDSD